MENQIRLYLNQINECYAQGLTVFRAWAKKTNVSFNVFIVTYTIDDCGPCSLKKIGDTWGLPKQTVHGVVRELEKQGLVTIEVNRTDRREKLISFTEAGQQFANKVLQGIHNSEHQVFYSFGEEQFKQYIAMMRKVNEMMMEDVNKN